MILINESLIDLLLSAAETLREETCKALEQYRTDRDREKRISERFKDESNYFNEKQSKLAANARDAIAKAERVFSSKVEEYTGQMEQQLKKHLSMPVNSQFREKLSMISDFGLQPEKIEIEDLLSLNGGNQTGLAALKKTLEKVNSPYTLKFHTTADYEADIAAIRSITRNMKYIPAEYHAMGVEVYKGIEDDLVYPNGGILRGGIRYDSIDLIASAASFETSIEQIKNMKTAWSADCTYGEAKQNTENNTESTTTIEDSPDNNEAVKIAKELAERNVSARQGINNLKAAGYVK